MTIFPRSPRQYTLYLIPESVTSCPTGTESDQSQVKGILLNLAG